LGESIRPENDAYESKTNYGKKTIYLQRGLNEVGVVQHLVHEVGHALWRPRAYTVNNLPAGMGQAIGDARTAYMNAPNGSQAERDAMAAYLKAVEDGYLQVQLENEGAAVLKNIAVRREMLVNGGADINVNCGASDCNTRYDAIYGQYLADNNDDKARKAIAVLRKEESTGSGPSYENRYRDDFQKDRIRAGHSIPSRKSMAEEALKGAKYGGAGAALENPNAPWSPLEP